MKDEPSDAQKVVTRAAVSAAMSVVTEVRSLIPEWQRAWTSASTAASAQTPSWTQIQQLLAEEAETPAAAAARFVARDQASRGGAEEQRALSAASLLGEHAGFLIHALQHADSWLTNAKQAATAGAGGEAGAAAQFNFAITQGQNALGAAMQHALFLTFLNDVRNDSPGDQRAIATYSDGWGLTNTQIDALWLWLTNDPLEFGGERLPVTLDTANRVAYRQAEDPWVKGLLASAVLWGAGIGYGIVALLFAVLHWAGVTTWPHEQWGWKMLVLFIFVALGAGIHLGSRVININYDNPISVSDAGNIIEWLSLRWVGILRMYIPVATVVASLWGAGNYPTTFQKLGTAILAGYSADSFVRAAVSKLQDQAAGKKPSGAAAKPPAATTTTTAT